MKMSVCNHKWARYRTLIDPAGRAHNIDEHHCIHCGMIRKGNDMSDTRCKAEMNKLRELIEANKARAFGYAKEPLDIWVREHLDDMADLIDAASVFDQQAILDALAKLENDK